MLTLHLKLFAFKLLLIKDICEEEIWVNTTHNSHVQVRPVALIAMKKCEQNVEFLMDSHINPETSQIENEGLNK